jgi:hypothetical protein
MSTPKTLAEAYAALDDLLTLADRAFIQQTKNPERIAAWLHHSLGRYLRNEWGLWQGSDLARVLRQDYGILHPDDMSHFILMQYSKVHLPTVWDLVSED